MSTFGLKAKGRKRMEAKLSQIWDHMNVAGSKSSSGDQSSTAPRAVGLEIVVSSEAAAEQKGAKRRNNPPKHNHGSSSGNNREGAKSFQSSVLQPPSKRSKNAKQPRTHSESDKTRDAPNTAADSKPKKRRTEASMAAVEAQLHGFLISHDEVYMQIVLFQELDLEDLLLAVNTAGIQVSKPELMAYLDRQGVIFSQAKKGLNGGVLRPGGKAKRTYSKRRR